MGSSFIHLIRTDSSEFFLMAEYIELHELYILEISQHKSLYYMIL